MKQEGFTPKNKEEVIEMIAEIMKDLSNFGVLKVYWVARHVLNKENKAAG